MTYVRNNAVSAARLRELLIYDPTTGAFFWRQWRNGRALAGQRAGFLNSHGYRKIVIDSRQYPAAALAWLYVNDRWPADVADHVNGDRADDRLNNLREATRSENVINRPTHKNNRSGLKGAAFIRREGKWSAQITVGGRRAWLGYFDTAEEAHAAYCAAAPKHHGEFARHA